MEPRKSRVKGSLRERAWIYAVLGVVVGGLVVWGLIAFRQEKDNAESQENADELSDRFREEGLDPPDQDIIVRLLGTNGGRVCEMAGDDLNEAALKLHLYTNGAGGPGTRPGGPVDERLLQGAVLVAEVYCPDKLEAIRDLEDDFDFEDVIND